LHATTVRDSVNKVNKSQEDINVSFEFSLGTDERYLLDLMTHLRLPAGTDVAEMALFDIDALPQSKAPDDLSVLALANSNRLVRFSTGADGGYLLHLFVDEPIPEDLMEYCLAEDKLSGEFITSRGNVAFGGLESTFAGFTPNRHIRSDGTINPGIYRYTAFHTEFPDEVMNCALQVETTPGERWLSRSPVPLVLTSIAAAFAFAVSQQFIFAGLVLFAGYFTVKWLHRIPAYQSIEARRDLAQLEFPSFVVEMRSNSSPEQSSSS
jgi:hypothetical protein